jgi:hypothetical protein
MDRAAVPWGHQRVLHRHETIARSDDCGCQDCHAGIRLVLYCASMGRILIVHFNTVCLPARLQEPGVFFGNGNFRSPRTHGLQGATWRLHFGKIGERRGGAIILTTPICCFLSKAQKGPDLSEETLRGLKDRRPSELVTRTRFLSSPAAASTVIAEN